MNQAGAKLSGPKFSDTRRHGNLAIAAEPAQSEATQLVQRARMMMLISALTTALAIAAVVGVIGYRMFSTNTSTVAADDTIPLPKGARLISTSASAGRLAVLIELDGVNELRTFDIKTLRQTGRLRFILALKNHRTLRAMVSIRALPLAATFLALAVVHGANSLAAGPADQDNRPPPQSVEALARA